MQIPVAKLRNFQLACFIVFVLSTFVTFAAGLVLIWSDRGYQDPWQYQDPWRFQLFSTLFLLAVLSGLLVSGTRSMIAGARGPADE